MSMPSLEPEETPVAPDELGLAGLSPNPLPPEESVELEEVNPAAIEGPGTALEPAGDGWALIALVPYDGLEPPAAVSDDLARAVWCAVSALWHPSILARASGLPRIESVASARVHRCSGGARIVGDRRAQAPFAERWRDPVRPRA